MSELAHIGFPQKTLAVNYHIDGVNFDLTEYLMFYSQKWGWLRTLTSSDGLSVPRLLWNIIPPTGKLLFAGIMHDGCYRDNMEQLQTDSTYLPVTFNEADSNALLVECANALGGNKEEIFAINLALTLYGWRAFNDDRKGLVAEGNPPKPLSP